MPSCAFTVTPGCCDHRQVMHCGEGFYDAVTDPDQRPSLAECTVCYIEKPTRQDRTFLHSFRAPVLCGHEESEHDPGDGSKEGRHDPTCMSCEQSGNVARYEAGAHPFTAEVAA